jgi:hypothetical protein
MTKQKQICMHMISIITLLTADSPQAALELGVPHFRIQEVSILNLSFEVCWSDWNSSYTSSGKCRDIALK